ASLPKTWSASSIASGRSRVVAARGRAWGSPLRAASSRLTADVSGRRARPARAPPSTSRCRSRNRGPDPHPTARVQGGAWPEPAVNHAVARIVYTSAGGAVAVAARQVERGGRGAPQTGGRKRALARWMFHSHLWLGIISTGIILLVAVTGVLLNHKRGLGLMPDPSYESAGVFENALPLAELARLAGVAVGPEVAAAGIDRMDVRPGDGIIKVRFDD